MSLTGFQQSTLLWLAREGVAAQVLARAPQGLEQPEGVLAECRGCFVTLRNQGALRGCIGTFHASRCLAEEVLDMGAAAATDTRFLDDPITHVELPALTVEVSVLSLLEPVADPRSLRVGLDGVYIVGRGRSGCFLPEVALEAGWDARELLDTCCTMKAGLPTGAWRDDDVIVYLFQSEKFSDASAVYRRR